MIPFVSKEDLLWKNKCGVLIVVVCGEVRAPKAQLPLRCGRTAPSGMPSSTGTSNSMFKS